MPVHRKTGSGQVIQARQAAVEFKDPSTGSALEVVVMGLAGDLVSGRFSRKLDGRKPTIVNQGLYVSIDSRDAQTSDIGLGQIKDFSCG